uniref:MEMO1 family protein ENV17_04920 n=1 Tax=Thermofilum pendens TaxID=2269 RepID=A0A7C4FBJ7_THEPE
MRKRYPAQAGYFYPKAREELLDAIRKAFLHELGPGELPPAPPSYTGRVIGAVVPHAGYMYSGHVAAHAYLRLAKAGKPEVVIILGPNHHGIGAPVAIDENEAWVTPLGEVQVDMEVAKLLASREELIRFDFSAHLYEHSIEVQVPFLQFVFGNDVRIVPITMLRQDFRGASRVASAIAKVVSEQDLKAYVLASSDMSHYVPAEVARRKDFVALRRVQELDAQGLYDAVIEEDISMCGYGPVMVLIGVAKELGFTRVELLKYADSGDVIGDKSEVVAYAALLFEKP